MVLDRAFAAPGDEDHLFDARRARFIHRILDERAIDDRQHLLRHGLGGWKKAGAKSPDRKYRLANWLELHELLLINEPRRQHIRLYQRFDRRPRARSEEHTSELHSLMRISYTVFYLQKQQIHTQTQH